MKDFEIPGLNNVFDIEDRQNFVRTFIANFDRKMIDKTDLIQGIYNVYFELISQKLFRCEADGCEEQLMMFHARIMGAIEKDGTLYKLDSLNPEIMEQLIGTNKKFVACLKHASTTVLIESEQPKLSKAKIIPLIKANSVNSNDYSGVKPPKKTPPKGKLRPVK